jgi:hypothetical protein
LFPDWLLVSMTGGALCCVVLGKWRWAALLAMPALGRYIVWPLAWHYLAAVPLLLLLLVGVVAIPLLFLRAIRRLFILASSERAADEALGHFFAEVLIAAFMGRRR